MRFRPEIEGLRGIAVLLVVLYHARVPGWSGGFIGVDVFFVLSGYLITGLIVSEIEREGRLSLLKFYARRARRLLPAAATAVIITLLAGLLILAPHEQVALARTAVATATYVSNLWFIKGASDYFSPRLESNPLLHTWSLAVEEQFYLGWPLLIALTLRWRRSRRALAVVLFSLCAVSFWASLRLTETHLPWAFFSSPTRAWEFGLGGLAALAPVQMAWLAWPGIATVLITGAAFSADLAFPGWLALLPVLGTVAVLVSGPTTRLHSLLSAAPLQWIGKRSYAWYLWHWPVLVLGAAIWRLTPGGRITLALVALLIAHASYHLVENPIRFHPRLVANHALSLALAALLTVGGLSLAWAGGERAVARAASPEQSAFTMAAKQRIDFGRTDCVAGWWNAEVHPCTYGAGDTTVVLLGDSHAAQWFPAARRMTEQRHWRLVVFLKVSCPVAAVPSFVHTMRRVEWECDAWRSEALRQIAALHPNLVMAVNSSEYENRVGPVAWQRGTHATLARLDSAGIATLMLRDTPRPAIDVPTCLARQQYRSWPGGNCDVDASVALPEEPYQAELEAIRGLEHVQVADLSSWFCMETCAAIINGIVVYRDTNHMTPRFAETLVRPLTETVGAALRAADIASESHGPVAP